MSSFIWYLLRRKLHLQLSNHNFYHCITNFYYCIIYFEPAEWCSQS